MKIKKIPEAVMDDHIEYDWDKDEHIESYIFDIDTLPNLTQVKDDNAYHLEDTQALDGESIDRNFKILARKINEIIDKLNNL